MCEEVGVRDPENISTSAYDLSEAAFKELYRDFDDDPAPTGEEPRPVSKPGLTPSQIAEARAGAKAAGDDRPTPQKQRAGGAAPAVSTSRQLVAVRGSRAKSRRPMSRLAATAVVLVACVLVLASLAYDPIQARLSALFPERRPPKVTGTLSVADLAAGHEIKPGETFAVNIPPGKVQIAVSTGEVALVTNAGATLRPCSKEPFSIETKSDAPGTPPPLIAACGKEPSSVEAVIPQPPLPAD
jgi:hypothetical protein